MKKIFNILFVVFFFSLIINSNAMAELLHEFAGGGDDGSCPQGSLIQDGSTLYGMTEFGGDSDCGVVFSINTDGTGYQLLHEFAGGVDDGKRPRGSLILSESTLYGMTFRGGDSDDGVVFSIGTDGTSFSLLHEFAGGIDDGSGPKDSLILIENALYGMTSGGGDGARGVIFKVSTIGTGFSLLHEFAGGGDDGSYPYGSLIVSGSTLYGMTFQGGDSDYGVVFRIDTKGTGFSLLHEFAGGADDGAYPYGTLILIENLLYAVTENGGDNDNGVVFSIGTDGAGFSLLHEFAGGSDDGASPYGSLILSGNKLYGMNSLGGDSDCGVIFKVTTIGTGFSLLHEFAGGSDDGAFPSGSLILSGSILYGMTSGGGDADCGVIFAWPLVPSLIPAIMLLL